MKKHFLLFGLGDLSKKLIPQLIRLANYYPFEIHIIEIKELNRLVESSIISQENIEWIKKRFLIDDNSNLFIENLKKRVGHSSLVIAYLAIPPNQYLNTISKYLDIVNIFALEKPWVQNKEQFIELMYIQQHNKDTKIIGVDHYKWKPIIKEFLNKIQENNYYLIRESNSFDLMLCEPSLDPIDRKYFWQTGIILDMIPHILSFLALLFGTNNKITIENVKPLICDDIIIRKVIEKYNKPAGFPIRETYSEIKLLISQYNVKKKIHIIIGKGISTKPIKLCNKKMNSNKFFCDSDGKFFLDISNKLYLINCKEYQAANGESEWYIILKSLLDEDLEKFIDIPMFEKYLNIYLLLEESIKKEMERYLQKEYDKFDYPLILLDKKNCKYKKGETIPLILDEQDCIFSNNKNNK